MIIKEKINDKYIRVYSDEPDKKIHIINTNIDKLMLLIDINNNCEFEEWKINEQYDIDVPTIL